MCKIKKSAIRKKLSQKKLAELVNCSIYKIQQWEKCLSAPKMQELPSLGYFLNVRVDYLIGTGKIKKIVPVSYTSDKEFNDKYRYVIFD